LRERTRLYLKRTGQFFSPEPIVRVAIDWAIQSKHDTVLDVATGRGIFLTEAFRRLTELGLNAEDAIEHLFGVELRQSAHKLALRNMENLMNSGAHHIIKANFFDLLPSTLGYSKAKKSKRVLPLFRAVVGNPPFIRYSVMTETTKAKAIARAEGLGFNLKGAVDESVFFLLHATSFLEPGGRLAFVIPERLLFTDYSSSLRNFLARQFDSIRMIFCNGWKFDGAIENVVLLLATNGKNSCIEVDETSFGNFSQSDISSSIRQIGRWTPSEAAALESWNLLRFKPELSSLLTKLKMLSGVHKLGDLAKVEIGCVTGANDFFVLRKNEREESRIPDMYFAKAVSKASHVQGVYFDIERWNNLYDEQERCSLLKIDHKLNVKRVKTLNGYISRGREQELKRRYKIGRRKAWYCVPPYDPPTAFFTYMAHRYPRLVLNDTYAINTNSIHSVRLSSSLPPLEFCASFYNSLTLLSCELLGRIYGEGVLKLEPSELSQALVVNPSDLSIAGDLLVEAKSIHEKLLKNELWSVLEVVDLIVLSDGLHLSKSETTTVRSAYTSLVTKRLSL
jgi:adenine-specific DNA-methyltransferase